MRVRALWISKILILREEIKTTLPNYRGSTQAILKELQVELENAKKQLNSKREERTKEKKEI